ncbi:MAG: GNAT family N-acetyltransferase [Ruminiclostridium sp.]
MIRKVRREDIPECVDVIKRSFRTVVEEFGLTEANAPRFTAFATTEERLFSQFDSENRPMYGYYDNGIICGYYSLHIQNSSECELNNLAVLPEFRHNGIGKSLFDHAVKTAKELGCIAINIGIIEENSVLKKWYEANGAVHTGTQKFDFFPFTCGYMKKSI